MLVKKPLMQIRVPGIRGRMFARQRKLEAAPKPDPLDHDGNGRKGGSLPSRAALIAEAEAIGAVFERRWNRKQIAEAIAVRQRYLGIDSLALAPAQADRSGPEGE